VLDRPDDEKGFRFVSGVRQTRPLQDLKIIIVTAYPTTERTRVAFREYNVHDFLDKGALTSHQLRETVAEALGLEETA
jgi:CheY-like chemotaxis protein